MNSFLALSVKSVPAAHSLKWDSAVGWFHTGGGEQELHLEEDILTKLRSLSRCIVDLAVLSSRFTCVKSSFFFSFPYALSSIVVELELIDFERDLINEKKWFGQDEGSAALVLPLTPPLQIKTLCK